MWLIFSITILFSAFPLAFSALGTGLLAPFTVALLAIVVRSVALGVRGSAATSARSHRLLSAVFGLASLVAPFAFGTIAGGLAQASVDRPAARSRRSGDPMDAPVCARCRRSGGRAVHTARRRVRDPPAAPAQVSPQAAERFRRRALQSGVAVLALMVAALVVAGCERSGAVASPGGCGAAGRHGGACGRGRWRCWRWRAVAMCSRTPRESARRRWFCGAGSLLRPRDLVGPRLTLHTRRRDAPGAGGGRGRRRGRPGRRGPGHVPAVHVSSTAPCWR